MEALFTNPVVLGVVAAVLVVVVVLIIIVKRYRIAKPDEAIIVTGRRGKQIQDARGGTLTDLSGQKVVTGGGVFVFPFVQRAFDLSLRSRKIEIQTTAQTNNGITINARAVAMIKVGGSEEMIRAAAQRFLSQQDEVEPYTKDVLAGSLRTIIGGLTVEKLIQDRSTLASEVLSAAEDALTKQGLTMDTLQIQDITDDQGYITNLGKPEAARVRQAAEIADTQANQASETAKISADQAVLDRQREYKLRQAAVQQETDKAAAQAAAAKPIEDAVQQQNILEQQEQAAQRQVSLREQQLNAEVRKVAEANAYQIEVTAKANAAATLAEANAERESRINKAEAVAAEGKAEGEAIEAKGKAEAAAIHARAEALREQSQAVLAQQVIEIIPRVAEALANGYANIDNFTLITPDGVGGVTNQMAGNLASTFQLVKDSTGIDVQGLLNSNVQGRAIGSGIASESESLDAGDVADAVAARVQQRARKPKAANEEIASQN